MASILPQRYDRDMIIVGLAFMLIVAIALFFGFRNSGGSKNMATTTAITPDATASNTDATLVISAQDLQNKLRHGDPVLIVDLRPADAFAIEHIPGSVNATLDTLSSISPKQGNQVVIVFSSDSFDLADQAKGILSEKSFPFVFLRGGYEGWIGTFGQHVSYGDPSSLVDYSKVTYLKVDDALAFFTGQNNFVIVDVRDATAYGKEHLAGAINIPLADIERRHSELTGNKSVVVYGDPEVIAFQAAVRLFDLGHFGVRILEGNFDQWKAKRMATEPAAK